MTAATFWIKRFQCWYYPKQREVVHGERPLHPYICTVEPRALGVVDKDETCVIYIKSRPLATPLFSTH